MNATADRVYQIQQILKSLSFDAYMARHALIVELSTLVKG